MATATTDSTTASDREETDDSRLEANGHLVRLGGGLGSVGGILTLVFFFVRPRTPEYTGGSEAILQVFATNGLQFEIHTLGVSLGFLFILGGFVGLRESLRGEPKASAWGQLGLVVAIVTTALVLLDTSIDGTVLVEIARMWAAAPTPEKSGALQVGELGLLLNVVILGRGIFLFQLAVLLFGIGIVSSSRYPLWLGLAGSIVGGLGVLAGGAMAAQGVPSRMPLLAGFLLMILGFLWISVVGRAVWKQTTEPPP